MQYSHEMLHHFTCDKCTMWWSISAIAELFINKKAWWCPWCGQQHTPPHDDITIGYPEPKMDTIDINDPLIPDELRERLKAIKEKV